MTKGWKRCQIGFSIVLNEAQGLTSTLECSRFSSGGDPYFRLMLKSSNSLIIFPSVNPSMAILNVNSKNTRQTLFIFPPLKIECL